MTPLRVLDLFSGLGGFSLGFEWASSEFQTVAFCEIDPYARKVLKKHWPEVPIYEDITKLGKKDIEEIGQIDCITGGFPCQDISVAGKQKGLGDEQARTRSGLFFEIVRLLELCRPRWVVLENVAALLSKPEWMGAVLGRLAEIGYDADWEIISAAQMGASHKRERVWIVAYPDGERFNERRSAQSRNAGAEQKTDHNIKSRENRNCPPINMGEDVADPKLCGCLHGQAEKQPAETGVDAQRDLGAEGKHEGWKSDPAERRDAIESGMGRVAHGIPSRVDRLKCLGNAIIPQIAELIGRQIMQIELDK